MITFEFLSYWNWKFCNRSFKLKALISNLKPVKNNIQNLCFYVYYQQTLIKYNQHFHWSLLEFFVSFKSVKYMEIFIIVFFLFPEKGHSTTIYHCSKHFLSKLCHLKKIDELNFLSFSQPFCHDWQNKIETTRPQSGS